MMPSDPYKLSQYACFRDLTEDQRQAITQLASEECFYPEHILYQDEKPGTHLYMLVSGEVEVLYNIGKEDPTRVEVVGEGEILGCSSLTNPYAYSSTARCLSKIDTLVLDAEELRKLMEEDCQIGYSIQKYIIQMLLDRILDLRLGK